MSATQKEIEYKNYVDRAIQIPGHKIVSFEDFDLLAYLHAVGPIGAALFMPPVKPKALADMSDAERKAVPLLTGVVDYFLPALVEVAKVSKAGNDQHNPGEPLHWAKGKSTDHGNTALRHLAQHGKIDSDGRRHTAKAAWRILAMLTMEIEAEQVGMSYDDYVKSLEQGK
jgi:hypothetical protein